MAVGQLFWQNSHFILVLVLVERQCGRVSKNVPRLLAGACTVNVTIYDRKRGRMEWWTSQFERRMPFDF